MLSLEKSVQLLSEVVDVLELFHYEQKDAIMKHESLLKCVIDRIESAYHRTNNVVNEVNELKSAKKHAGKRVSYGLLLPIDYYVNAFEEAFDSVIVAASGHDEQVRTYAEATLHKYMNQLEYLIVGGTTRMAVTNDNVVFTHSFFLVRTNSLTHSLTARIYTFR